jgi:hypothetical protein
MGGAMLQELIFLATNSNFNVRFKVQGKQLSRKTYNYLKQKNKPPLVAVIFIVQQQSISCRMCSCGQ